MMGHTTPLSSFKFDAGSSRSNSMQDSDMSESNSPRYTYTFPRSGEGTPHIARAYDQVDLLRDQVPFPPIKEDKGLHHSMMMNHDLVRFTASRTRLGSDASHSKMNGGQFAMDSSSPHLQAQVTI